MTTSSSMNPKARAQRMQKRADDAALSAAQARARCEEKQEHLKHLVMEVDAQQSSAVEELCNSPSDLAKRVDLMQLKCCSSPSDRFAHQLDLLHGTHQVVEKLEKRIDSLQKHCGQCKQDFSSCTCNCIGCWDVRAEKKQAKADTLRRAAEIADKQQHGYRASSVGAVNVRASARHLKALQEAANLHEDSKLASTKAQPVLMRRTMPSDWRYSCPEAVSLTKPPSTTGSRPRSASCAFLATRRRRVKNDDF